MIPLSHLTKDEQNLYKILSEYSGTVESVMFSESINEEFDPYNKETWSGFYRGIYAAYMDMMNRLESGLKENLKNRDQKELDYSI